MTNTGPTDIKVGVEGIFSNRKEMISLGWNGGTAKGVESVLRFPVQSRTQVTIYVEDHMFLIGFS